MRKALILSTLVLSLAACGDDVLEIIGTYDSNFGSEEVITEDSFVGTPIRGFDNEANFLITQNPADSMFSPNLFNRIVWTEPEGSGAFYYCFVDFNLPSLEAAETSTQTADASDPMTTGCGTFSWTRLEPK